MLETTKRRKKIWKSRLNYCNAPLKAGRKLYLSVRVRPTTNHALNLDTRVCGPPVEKQTVTRPGHHHIIKTSFVRPSRCRFSEGQGFFSVVYYGHNEERAPILYCTKTGRKNIIGPEKTKITDQRVV
ncbi:unnamed protein product [Nesidiocoris tenuis]|uniref:Uncharacterized protein n=1 Tax=Nesidiocoris tenuis TaxID=355587 RepID=A0A6H5GVB8_9HEMI|nr:unnamed protein product [Nesidiocoris tenuis]